MPGYRGDKFSLELMLSLTIPSEFRTPTGSREYIVPNAAGQIVSSTRDHDLSEKPQMAKMNKSLGDVPKCEKAVRLQKHSVRSPQQKLYDKIPWSMKQFVPNTNRKRCRL